MARRSMPRLSRCVAKLWRRAWGVALGGSPKPTRARAIAREVGLRHVYVGNVHDRDGQTTRCASCDHALIERDWFAVRAYRLRGSACERCGETLPGVFAQQAPALSGGSRRSLPFAGPE